MADSIKLVKQSFGRNSYQRVVDTEFTEFITPTTSSAVLNLSVEEFFDLYDALFFSIPATGEVNSHESLVKRSSDYLGGATISDTERAYLEEINALRQQLVEQAQTFLNLDKLL